MTSFSNKLFFLQFFSMVIILMFTFDITQNGVQGWKYVRKTGVRIYNGLGGDDFR
jgi:hypothetical protein